MLNFIGNDTYERIKALNNKEELICARKKTSIGGQALIEGIMMRGPKKTAMAVRHVSGEMKIKEWETSNKKVPGFFKIPIIRGVYNFAASMKLGYKCLMESAEMSGLDDEINEKKDVNENKSEEKKPSAFMNVLMVIASVLGVILSLGLFIFLPNLLFNFLADAFPAIDKRFYRSLFTGILKIIIFVLYMVLVSLMKDIRRTFMYHGAEHKTIFCYEAGLELTVENVKKMNRFHPRCGTSFMILMLIVSIFITMLIPFTNPLLRTACTIVLLPITMGLGYELIKIAGRHDNFFTRLISLPGVWLQHVSVLEPDDSMIECAIEAVKRVIPDDDSDRW